MTEWCVKFPSERHLGRQQRFLESHRLGDLDPPLQVHPFEERALKDLHRDCPAFDSQHVDRVYLGSEFCRYLAAPFTEVQRAFDLLLRKDFQLTLVLPPQYGRHLQETVDLIREFSTLQGLEVVVNDWGTANALSDLPVNRNLGRMLFKAKRLPRLSGEILPVFPAKAALGITGQPEFVQQMKEVRNEQLAALSQWPFSHPESQRMLNTLAINRVELEMLPQGIQSPPKGTLCSLYAPFTYVTGGGPCPVASLKIGPKGTTCGKACRQTVITPTFDQRTWPIVQTGHTNFARMSSLLKHYCSLDFLDRFVVEYGLPM